MSWSRDPGGSASQGQPLPSPSSDLVTVVIPARNEADSVARCLDSVLGQTYRELQVIVVDGDSQDATRAVVEAYAQQDPRVELVRNPEAIIPVGMNLGLQAARGRWLVRVDAHATIGPDYVARVVAHLRSGRWGGVGGRKDGVGSTPAGCAIAAAMASRFGVGDSVYHYGTRVGTVDHVPFGAYPVALARAVGGWDRRLLVGQDHDFDRRIRDAGYQLLFDPALRIEWECRQSIRALFRQYRRYGRDRIPAMRAGPGNLRLRHTVPPALLAALIAAVLLAPLSWRVAAGLVAPYLVALLGASLLTLPKITGNRARTFLPAAFLAMHLGWGLGFWEGLAGRPPAAATSTPRQRAKARTTTARNFLGRGVTRLRTMPRRGV